MEDITAEFEVRQANTTNNPHLTSKGVDLNPVKLQHISRNNVTRTMINKSWQFLTISKTLMWLAERDIRNFQLNTHWETITRNNKKDSRPLNATSFLIKDRNWSVYNTLVLEWQNNTMAKCIAICQIRDEI